MRETKAHVDEALTRAVAALAAQPAPLTLRCVVQPYAWGGYDYIPRLLGVASAPGRPAAELWIGTHPLGSATTEIGGVAVDLRALVERAPATFLGAEVAARFGGELPYLLKILDVRQPLSIQAHPDKDQARAGFAREDAEGVPLSAPHRSYKDANHKPEAAVALTEFWMLHGFKPLDAIAATLAAIPELEMLLPGVARATSLRPVYESLMTKPQAEVDRLLEPLLARLARRRQAGDLERDDPDYWAARAAVEFPLPEGHRDRGIVSIYLLNLIRLEPGQATFLAAGQPHAYLEGVSVEVMANSDNVLRGGLTPKHVDVPELLRTLRFESGPAAIVEGARVSPTETLYRFPAEEFELSRIDLAAGAPHESRTVYGADALLVLDGDAALLCGGETRELRRGDVVLVPSGLVYRLASERAARLFKAAVPRPS